MDWTEKVVLITGGSAGLGRATADAFARRGASLVLVARNPDRLEQTASVLRQQGTKVLCLATDVTKESAGAEVIARTCDQYGRLDVLVNNVGRSARASVVDTSVDDFNDLMQTNFLPIVRFSRAAIPSLQQTQGCIVNIGSLASKSVGLYLGAYPVTKYAVAAYSTQLRLELANRGIHVLLVCPGPIARGDAGERYDEQVTALPSSAKRPGAGVRLGLLSPDQIAHQLIDSVETRRAELIMPTKARWFFALTQLFPRWGDRILRNRFKQQEA
ncbi:MAG: SDR family NAD(P)-dependent oxidoreductase [Pirellulaceae bacterium]|nr:SDR family NAD(P)-dependent oxidoreductase [Pirellulaceae bacterium]